MMYIGQLKQLHEEVGSLREQLKGSSNSQEELQKAKAEVKSLKQALDEAKAEQTAISKDLDKWHQTATKYEREIENLQRDLQQQSKQWQKTAEIQGKIVILLLVIDKLIKVKVNTKSI